MPEFASELLAYHGYLLDPLSRLFLRLISLLDDAGAWEWNLRYTAITSFLLLGLIRLSIGKKGGIDWYAFIHAVLSAAGAFVVLYLDFMASEALTGVEEPLRSVTCHGPLTSLHRILPAITWGYSVFDIIDGFSISFDFILHGVATFAVMGLYCEFDVPHILAPMLFMEFSTIFLSLVKATILPPLLVQINQALFVVSFFFCRLVIVPFVWGKLMRALWTQQGTPEFLQCLHPSFVTISFCGGMFYHILNAYWFRKIIRKAQRRILGIEKHDERNEFADEADHHQLGRKQHKKQR
jgi:TLC domain